MIQGTEFSKSYIESGQIIKLPDLNGCSVYGLMSNGFKAHFSPIIDSDDYERIQKLGSESQIKWVIGQVNHLGKGGINWLRYFTDTDGDDVKGENEAWFNDNKGKTLKKISNIDLHGINDRYELVDTIDIWFPKSEKFKPNLYWIEPFLIHPELHFSKNPKGCFIISIDIPQPYQLVVSGYNFDLSYIYKEVDSSKDSYFPCFYYGDVVELEITTIQVPDRSELLIEIYNSQNKLVSEPEIMTTVEKKYLTNILGDTELDLYAQNIFKVATIEIPLDIRFKPDSQAKDALDFLEFRISYTPKKEIIFIEDDGFPRSEDRRSNYDPKKIEALEVIRQKQLPLKFKEQKIANEFKVITLIGYLPVYFKDTKSYITTREEQIQTALKMVEVGADSKQAPGNNPCHYTKIMAERVKDASIDLTPKPITLFDEANQTENTPPPIIHIKTGDSGSSQVKISVDLDTENQCRDGVHSTGNSIFLLDDSLARAQRLQDYKIGEDFIELNPRYIYIKDSGDLFPINYFNPQTDDEGVVTSNSISYFIPIRTCRYKHNVHVLVYPDIEFWIEVSYNADPKHKLYVNKTPNSGYRIGRGDQNYNQKQIGKYNAEKYKTQNKKYEFDFNIGYRYNGQELSLETLKNKLIPIFQIAKFAIKAYEVIKVLVSADSTAEVTTSIRQNSGYIAVRDRGDAGNNRLSPRYEHRKSKGLPIRIDVSRPSVSAALTAAYSFSNKSPDKIGWGYSFSFRGDPVIKVVGKLDLLFYAQFIPYIGQGIKAINKVVDTINFLTLGVVDIDFYIDLVLDGSFSLDIDALSYHSIDGLTVVDKIESKTHIGVSLQAGAIINISIKTGKIDSESAEGGFSARAHIKGEASVDIILALNIARREFEASITFNGLKAEITINLNVKDSKNKSRKKPKIVDILDSQDPWKIKII